MRILQIIPNLSGGGAERFVVDLCNELGKVNEVHLITLYDLKENDIFQQDLDKNIKVYSLGKKLGFDPKMISRLYKLIKSIRPDIIHNHMASLNYLLPIIPLLRSTPIFHTIHNDAFKECPSMLKRKIRAFYIKKDWLNAITISNESNQSFKKAYNGIKSNLIYNGRQYPLKSHHFLKTKEEIDSYKINEDTKVFVNIGSIDSQKNQIMLIHAFQHFLREHNSNAVLLIIGGGRNSEQSKLIEKKLNDLLKNQNQIMLLGEKSNATDYLHLSDFFCLSSVMEGMPISLIEAFATKNIPICTSVGGMTEMVSDIDANLLSTKVQEKEYANALNRAYNYSEEEQNVFKDKIYQLFTDKYSIEHCAKVHHDLYNILISKY